MLNSVSIMGRLTREPELKYTQQGVPVCTVGLAIQRDFADSNGVRDADFIDVVFWRHNADFVAKYMHKGQLVAVAGRIRTRYWQDGYDQRRTAVEIEAEHVYFAEKTDPSDGTQRSGPGGEERDGHLGNAQRAFQPGTRNPLAEFREFNTEAAAARTSGRDARAKVSTTRPVDPRNAEVEADTEYMDDLYRLPASDFAGLDDDEDTPF